MPHSQAATLESRMRQLSLASQAKASLQPPDAGSALVSSDYAAAGSLLGVSRGLEKENLRVLADGSIAQTTHPAALGSPLTHPAITTDFSEGLLEVITRPKTSPADLFNELLSLEHYVLPGLADELLWAGSMPPMIVDPVAIRIADYGHSAMGQMKHIYREGLALRYGKMMQVIAGIHFNFSFSDSLMQQLSSLEGVSVSDLYMAQVRQMLRDLWILPYLFGASPAASRSSVTGTMPDHLQGHAHNSVLGVDATSLRLGGLGYHNKGEDLIVVDYSSVAAYAQTLFNTTQTPYPEYENLACEHTLYRQLNSNILQIENEYYMPVRPKQVAGEGEIPSRALASRGVQYVELRALDLDPFTAQGINSDTVAFLDVFMFAAMLAPSPVFNQGSLNEIEKNIAQVATYGRRSDLELCLNQQTISFQDASFAAFDRFEQVARWMDQQHGQGPVYQQTVAKQKLKLTNVSLTPSAKVVAALTSPDIDYDDWVLQQSKQHAASLRELTVDSTRQAWLNKITEQSQLDFKRLEDDACL